MQTFFPKKRYSYKSSIKEINFNNKIYAETLNSLYHQLNKIHNIRWKKRSWEILIGPWLIKYITVFTQRYEDFKIAKKNNNFINKKKIKLKKLNLFQFCNYNDFHFTAEKFEFNQKFLQKIFLFNFLKKESIKKFENKIKKDKKNQNRQIKLIFSVWWNSFINLISFRKDIFIDNLYIGDKFFTIKLLIKNFLIPLKYSRPNLDEDFKHNSELRKKLYLKNYKDDFSNKFNFFLAEMFPQSYLENFRIILNKSKKLYPKKIKKIISANIFSDNYFKFWVADQINNKNVKLNYLQHGGGYDIFPEDIDWHLKHELSISDKYFSWGFNGRKKIFRGQINSCISQKKFDEKKIKFKFLLAPNHIRNFISGNYPYDFIEKSYEKKNFSFTTDFLINFIRRINKNIKSNLKIKFHPHENKSEYSLKKHLLKNHKYALEDANKDILKILKFYGLYIHTHCYGTSFQKTISLNYPSVCLIPPKKDFFNKKYLKIFRELLNVKIFHQSPESLAKFLNKFSTKKDILNWWLDKKVQKARIKYCSEQAFIEKNKFLKLSKFINS